MSSSWEVWRHPPVQCSVPCVTPDHSIVQRPPCAPVPEDGGLPLVGDPHPGQPLETQTLASELLSDGLNTALNWAQQLSRPLLNPADEINNLKICSSVYSYLSCGNSCSTSIWCSATTLPVPDSNTMNLHKLKLSSIIFKKLSSEPAARGSLVDCSDVICHFQSQILSQYSLAPPHYTLNNFCKKK